MERKEGLGSREDFRLIEVMAVQEKTVLRDWKIKKGKFLMESILEAFLTRDAKRVRDELGKAINRMTRMVAEGQDLTELWKDLARVYYEVWETDLGPELRERRGYLEAVVHFVRAMCQVS